MKTAKIESYRFILYRIESAVQRIDISILPTCALYLAFLRRKKLKGGV